MTPSDSRLLAAAKGLGYNGPLEAAKAIEWVAANHPQRLEQIMMRSLGVE